MTLVEVVPMNFQTAFAGSSGPDPNGCRPVCGGRAKFPTDSALARPIFCHEYFYGDNGAGDSSEPIRPAAPVAWLA